jgi:hypothetical protein
MPGAGDEVSGDFSMSCDKILQEICAELSEDVDSQVCERLRSHLQECPQCSQQLSSMRTTVHLYHCLGEQEVPRQIHQRLAKMLNLVDAAGLQKR